ncbi:peptidase C39 [Rhodoferax koreense]|uniref:Peptidase C39 n=1 Tax=Rhodoferax koreensis TaxID=1842727 RepID=A0A1P8JY29_9BURK|nr:C39 family peptidase [Rhodoferax koreense]APW38670.1 peptidase C39 [Rhodoferax koreense]
MPRLRHLLAFPWLALCLGGAAHAQAANMIGPGGDVRVPVTSIKQARQASTLLQQYDFSCGSAAVATLLTYHFRYPITEQRVFEDMFAHGDQQKIRREGFSLLDMKRALALYGFEADGFEQPLEKLNEARVPAIVLMVENGYHHFVVVKGVQSDRVLIGDPAQGTRAMSRQTFEAAWPSRLLFVVHNRMDIARFNLPGDWQVAQRAPLVHGLSRESGIGVNLPALGPGDF